MGYIPFYDDGYVEAGIVLVWIVVGVVAVIRGRRQSLPRPRLIRRVLGAVWCAFLSFVLYSCYILQRQSVENAANNRARAEERIKHRLGDDAEPPKPAYQKRNGAAADQ